MKSQQPAFTLVELLLYIVIMSTLLLGITQFFMLMLDARVKNQTVNDVNQQGLFIMDSITHSIRNATSVTSPATGATGASLTLVVPTSSASPTVFDLNGTTLRIKEGVATAIALTNNDVEVTNLSFRNLSRSGTSAIVQVRFTLDRVNPSGRNTYDYQREFIGSAEVGW